jgi:hypothetical protein
MMLDTTSLSEMTDMADMVIRWVIAPMVAAVWFIYREQQNHRTDIAVLKAEIIANKLAHDREFKAMGDNFKAVMSKLDSIEEALRK